METEVIREYLVSLGFEVDSKSLNQAKSSLNMVDGLFGMFGGNVGKMMAKASMGVIGFVASGTAALVKFGQNLAQTDLEMQMFGRRMGMGTENAYSFNTALKSLGVSLEDLYLSPELAAQFMQLRREANSIRPPEDMSYILRQVREVGFEISRLKNTFSYAGQWIGYYLYAYLEKPIQTAKETLKSWNEGLQANIPVWTKSIAQVLSWFVRLGSAAVRGIKDLGTAVFDFFSRLPREVNIAIAAIAAAGYLLTANPLTLWIAAIAGALLLLDDFYTHMSGGEAAFGDLWNWLSEAKGRWDAFAEGLDIGEKVESLSSNLGSIGENLGNITREAGELLDNLSKNEWVQNAFTWFIDGITALIDKLIGGIKDLTTWLSDLFTALNDVATGKKSWFDFFKDGFEGAFKTDEQGSFGFRNWLVESGLAKEKNWYPAPGNNATNSADFTQSAETARGFNKPSDRSVSVDPATGVAARSLLDQITQKVADAQLTMQQAERVGPVTTNSQIANTYSSQTLAPEGNDYSINIYGSEPQATAAATKRQIIEWENADRTRNIRMSRSLIR